MNLAFHYQHNSLVNPNLAVSPMAIKQTQTSLSSNDTFESAQESTSVHTLFDDGDPFDVADVLEGNEGFGGENDNSTSNEKESLIVGWDGPNDPARHTFHLGFVQEPN